MQSILVVDDNEMLCRLTCDILAVEGFRAIPATCASDALAALASEHFDLVVTDFRMPGMSGLELAQTIRKRDPRFPIIVMSVYEAVPCKDITLWLPKEYLFPSLVDKIRFCLSTAESEKVGK